MRLTETELLEHSMVKPKRDGLNIFEGEITFKMYEFVMNVKCCIGGSTKYGDLAFDDTISIYFNRNARSAEFEKALVADGIFGKISDMDINGITKKTGDLKQGVVLTRDARNTTLAIHVKSVEITLRDCNGRKAIADYMENAMQSNDDNRYEILAVNEITVSTNISYNPNF